MNWAPKRQKLWFGFMSFSKFKFFEALGLNQYVYNTDGGSIFNIPGRCYFLEKWPTDYFSSFQR